MLNINFETDIYIGCISFFYSIDSNEHIWIPGESDLPNSFDRVAFDAVLYSEHSPKKIDINLSEVKSTGLQRYRSSTKAIQLASILLHKIRSKRTFSSRVGLLSISQTSTQGISYEYDHQGIKQGWDVIDPFWLPNSIPSALATHLANILPEVKTVCSFIGGINEFITALETAYYFFSDDIVDEVVIVVAEQINQIQIEANMKLGNDISFFEGASIIILTRNSYKNENWTLVNVRHCEFNEAKSDETFIIVPDPEPAILTLMAPYEIFRKINNINNNFSLKYAQPDNTFLSMDFKKILN